MSQILVWISGFLPPGYAWPSVVQRGAVLSLPSSLRFTVGRLKKGARAYPARVPERDIGEVFRTDVAINATHSLRGWFLRLGNTVKKAPWFQLTPLALQERFELLGQRCCGVALFLAGSTSATA